MLNAGMDVTRTAQSSFALPLFLCDVLLFLNEDQQMQRKKGKNKVVFAIFILCEWIEVFFSAKVLIRVLVFWAHSLRLCC